MKAKKIFKGMTAAAIAAVLAASMVPMTAFAADATITLKPVQNMDEHASTSSPVSTTYNIYKVFDANYAVSTEFQAVSITMTKNDSSTDAFTLGSEDAATKLAEYCSSTENTSHYKANIKALTDALVNSSTKPTPITVSNITSDTNQTLDSNCYYLVVPTATAQMNIAPSLITASNGISIEPKTSSISVDKSIDKINSEASSNISSTNNSAVVKIDDIVTYSITSQIPRYADSVTSIAKDYKITDTPSKGLDVTFDKNTGDSDDTDGITVSVTGATATKDTDYHITKTSASETSAAGFQVIFEDAFVLANGGKTVVVTFDAKVNSSAVVSTTGNPNNAKVSFDNDYKEANSSEYTDIEDEVTVYRTKLEFVKEFYNKDSQNLGKVAGATFVLSKQNDEGNYDQVDTFTTDASTNTKTFDKLEPGTYKLVETAAPEGYAKVNGDIIFGISAGTVTESGEYNGEFTFRVTNGSTSLILEQDSGKAFYTGTINNTKGQSLPGTGGVGTTIFTIAGVGVVLVAGAMLVVYMRKRRTEDEE